MGLGLGKQEPGYTMKDPERNRIKRENGKDIYGFSLIDKGTP